MWIENRARQHRVYWRTGLQSPAKAYEPFADRQSAEQFVALVAALGDRDAALAFVRGDLSATADRLNQLGRTAGAQSTVAVPGPSMSATQQLVAAEPAVAELGHVGTCTGGGPGHAAHDAGVVVHAGVSGHTTAFGTPLVGLTFGELWGRFLEAQRHLEDSTSENYEGYGTHHLLPFFGDHDLALIQRAKPLREQDAVHGAVYVDDWVKVMLAKQRLNNVARPIADSKLSIKFIKNVLTVLAQAFDMALHARPVLIDINPARGIRLPKQDRREMHFLDDEHAYMALRDAMHAHYRPLLDFLVGTGARFGEAAGLLVRHLHLDAEHPYVEIRLVLKWARKRWKLGRPKTRSSVRRITLPPRLVEVLRHSVASKGTDDHVFTTSGGRRLHHGNFLRSYFRPAVNAAGRAVPRGLRIHDLRHTHAAWLISDGASIVAVQRRLGHRSSVTTTDVYGHLTPEADARTVEMANRRLPGLVERDAEGALVLRLTKLEQSTYPEFDDVDDDDDLAA